MSLYNRYIRVRRKIGGIYQLRYIPTRLLIDKQPYAYAYDHKG
jgi:hypothetical protein